MFPAEQLCLKHISLAAPNGKPQIFTTQTPNVKVKECLFEHEPSTGFARLVRSLMRASSSSAHSIHSDPETSACRTELVLAISGAQGFVLT